MRFCFTITYFSFYFGHFGGFFLCILILKGRLGVFCVFWKEIFPLIFFFVKRKLAKVFTLLIIFCVFVFLIYFFFGKISPDIKIPVQVISKRMGAGWARFVKRFINYYCCSCFLNLLLKTLSSSFILNNKHFLV